MQVKNTQLHSLLELSLLPAKKHSKQVIKIDKSPTQIGSDTYMEEFKTSKARAGELVTQSDEAFRIRIPTS